MLILPSFSQKKSPAFKRQTIVQEEYFIGVWKTKAATSCTLHAASKYKFCSTFNLLPFAYSL
jgi:hypothetical protein